MLTPQTLAKLPDEMVDLVNDLQMDIIRSIAKKLVKADYLTPSAEWQLYKAQQLRMSTKEVNELIARFTGLSRRKVAQLYTDGCMEAIRNDAKIYRAYGKDTSAALRSVALSNTLRAGIKNANGMTRNLCKSMVETSRETVTYLMDKAYIKVASGAFSYQEAIYDSVKELAERGIKSVQYPSGHRDWADVAVRRAVMTGISQTAGQMQLDLAAEMDCDLVEVTSHIGARPSHAEWQGKIFSISGKSKKYPKLSAATGYGTGDGLKGWNCRHDFFPFFEGISERVQVPVDTKENKEFYEKEQRQRAMERAVRASKRSLSALDSALQSTNDPELKARLQSDFDRKSSTLKRQEARLAAWCEENDLYPQNDRVRVVGFGRSVSQKAVHGAKRYDKAKAEETGQKRTKPDSTGQKETKPDKAVEVTVPANQSEGLKYADVPITGRKYETFEKKVDISGESDIIKLEEAKRILEEKIESGEITLEINEQLQARHYIDSAEYADFLARGIEKSYFVNTSQSELQDFLIKNHGTGIVLVSSSGKKIEEILYYGEDAAYDTKLKKLTSYIKVHYSKNRTHLSPYTPRKK